LRRSSLAPSTSSERRSGKYHSTPLTGWSPNHCATRAIGETSPSSQSRGSPARRAARAQVDQPELARRRVAVEGVPEEGAVRRRHGRLELLGQQGVVAERRQRGRLLERVQAAQAGEDALGPRQPTPTRSASGCFADLGEAPADLRGRLDVVERAQRARRR
jgi:hypothetical protein